MFTLNRVFITKTQFPIINLCQWPPENVNFICILHFYKNYRPPPIFTKLELKKLRSNSTANYIHWCQRGNYNWFRCRHCNWWQRLDPQLNHNYWLRGVRINVKLKILIESLVTLTSEVIWYNVVQAVAKQMARLQIEVQNLEKQIQYTNPVTKDLSLVVLVPK